MVGGSPPLLVTALALMGFSVAGKERADYIVREMKEVQDKHGDGYPGAAFDPLARGQNILPGLHGDTQATKLLGHLTRYVYTGDKSD